MKVTALRLGLHQCMRRGLWRYLGAAVASIMVVGCQESARVIILQPGEIIVQPGDTIYSLAQRHNVSVRLLVQLNGLYPPYTLKPLDRLRLPGVHTPTPDQEPISEAPPVIHQGPQLMGPQTEFDDEPLPVQTPAVKDSQGPGTGNSENKHTPMAHLSAKNKEKTEKLARFARQDPGAHPGRQGEDKLEKMSDKNAGFYPNTAQPRALHAADTKTKAHNDGDKRQKDGPDKASAPGKESLTWPVKGRIVGQFNPSQGIRGITLQANAGAPVYAAKEGVVLFAEPLNGQEPTIVIQHDDNSITACEPLKAGKLAVSVHQRVKKGQLLGYTHANTLYFEYRPQQNKAPVDPAALLDKKS